MAIGIKSVYDGVVKDNINTPSNGDLSFDRFNRLSKRAELRMLDWITGDIAGIQPPQPYLTQKNKDWAAFLLKDYQGNVSKGFLDWPEDYYLYEAMRPINSSRQADCETGKEYESDEPGGGTIEVLDTQVFDDRANTYVKRLKPTSERAIAREVGRQYRFLPKDLGPVELTYYRYPVYGQIVSMKDVVFNQPVINESASTNYEWPDFALELLIWFITDTAAISTRENALKEQNNATKKTTRG